MTQNTLVIERGMTERYYWRDLWRYRELFFVLAWRDVSVRYKQSIFGLAWALVRPFLTMVVFTVVFSKVAKLPAEGMAPYALLVFAGLLPWQFFASALTDSSNSLLGNANLISKVYFPRMIVPTAAVVTSFIDFLVSFLILIALMLWYRFVPGWQLLTLPLFVFMVFLAGLGPGLFIASINVKYRDFRFITPFIVQLGLYVSPVGFSSSVVPEDWRLLYALNPMVGIIDGFRWAILGGTSPMRVSSLLTSWLLIVSFLWLGIRQFRKMEKSFSDMI